MPLQVAEAPPAVPAGPKPALDQDFRGWAQHQKARWRTARGDVKRRKTEAEGRQAAQARHGGQGAGAGGGGGAQLPAPQAGPRVAQMLRQQDAHVTSTPWQVLQLAHTDVPGRFKVGAGGVEGCLEVVLWAGVWWVGGGGGDYQAGWAGGVTIKLGGQVGGEGGKERGGGCKEMPECVGGRELTVHVHVHVHVWGWGGWVGGLLLTTTHYCPGGTLGGTLGGTCLGGTLGGTCLGGTLGGTCLSSFL